MSDNSCPDLYLAERDAIGSHAQIVSISVRFASGSLGIGFSMAMTNSDTASLKLQEKHTRDLSLTTNDGQDVLKVILSHLSGGINQTPLSPFMFV
jgi:hypothetical protein